MATPYDPPTFVYLIETALGQLKIGCSHNPELRLRTFRAYSSCPIRLIAQWPGKLKDEKALHKQFAEHRWHNEWFRIEGPLVEFVAAKRGQGVIVPEWADVSFKFRSDRYDLSTEARSLRMKAVWADPAFRRQEADRRRRLAFYERSRGDASQPDEALARIEAYLAAHQVAPHVFGEGSPLNDRWLLDSLRSGKRLKPEHREALIAHIASLELQQSEAA